MKTSTTRRLTALVLGGASFLIWRAPQGPDLVAAQTRKPIMVTRIFTGPDGESHAEETEMKLSDRGIFEVKATNAQFSSRLAGPPNNNWHTGPRRQYVITLSGRAEIEVGGGKRIAIGPGHINLIEDTTGKGHITRNLEDRIVLTIPLEDQSK